MTYKVEEAAVTGYTTTYDGSTTAEAVPSTNSDTSRYTITNTITQQYIKLEGTKTWIDGGLQHDNSTDVTLIVTRSSASTETVTLTEGADKDYQVSWSGNTYTITGTGDGLPKYDPKGYEYTYTVTEKANRDDGRVEVTVGKTIFIYEITQTGNDITNTRDEDPTDPTKTVEIGDDDAADDNGEAVSVGDEITYTISYFNSNSEHATVTITDVLDEGVDYVSSSKSGVYDAATHTVTWTIEDVNAFAEGSVTLTVKVNADAVTTDATGAAFIVNDADVTVGNQAKQTTNPVKNPLEPDDPVDPVKTVSVGAETEVAVGDTLVYTISYYNNNSTSATVTITDVLEDGLTWVSGGTLGADGKTVTWTIEAAAYEAGTVTLTAKVNDSAAGDKVSNTASVKIGNAAAVNTNTVTNDVEEVSATPSPTPTSTSGTTPQTGDDARLGLWIAILTAGAMGLACVGAVTASRKKRSGK
ncbi:MAG: DUF11 domain-containing protein [Oscillospiraceae bacterium]|nr:DUF11 domain-containing protein [Oscillospiraceae bacterium]